MTPGVRLKQSRKRLGMTQQELGDQMGVKGFTIKDMESGKQKVNPDFAQEMENKFSIDFRWLLTGEGSMFRKKHVTVAANPGTPGTVAEPTDPTLQQIMWMLEDAEKMVRKDVLHYLESLKHPVNQNIMWLLKDLDEDAKKEILRYIEREQLLKELQAKQRRRRRKKTAQSPTE